MQIEKIKERLTEYLKEDKEGKVISINGEWGVGKTRFWKDYIKGTSGYEYAYVSLYGKKNIEEIETDISIQLSDMQHLVKIAKDKLNGFKKISSLITMLESRNFNNVIICFDDFERLDKLNIESVLGLISNLKENKNCRIVMILNEEQIESDKFSLGKEKIIDYEFLYNPKVEFSLSKTPISSLKFFPQKEIENYLEVYKINNIRVLKKMIKLLTFLEEYLIEFKTKEYFKELLSDILYDVLPYLYIYYKYNFKNFDDLISYSQKEKLIVYSDDSDNSGIEENKVYEKYITYFHGERKIYQIHLQESLLYFFSHGYFNNTIKRAIAIKYNYTAKGSHQKKFNEYYNSIVYGVNLDFEKSSLEMVNFLKSSKHFFWFLFSNLKQCKDKISVLIEIDKERKEFYEKIFMFSSKNYLEHYKTHYPEKFFDYSFIKVITEIEELAELFRNIQRELLNQTVESNINVCEESIFNLYNFHIDKFQEDVLINLSENDIKNILESHPKNAKVFFDLLEAIYTNDKDTDYKSIIEKTLNVLNSYSQNSNVIDGLKKKFKSEIPF